MSLIRWLQTFESPLMDSVWGTITQMGSEDFFLIFVPLIFWCIDDRRGWLFLNLLIVSTVSNDLLKNLFATSRPDPSIVRVIMSDTGTGYAFPSGHTQNAAVFWGYLASQLKHKVWWALAGLMVLLVGASRLYLGLHWPQDVLGGFLFGSAIVVMGMWVTPRIISGDAFRSKVILSWASVALPILAFAAFPNDITALALGVICGVNLGYVILLPAIGGGFPVRVAFLKQVAKMVIGLGGLLLIRVLLKMVLPDLAIFRFIRYAVMGIWCGLAAPLLFAAWFSDRQGTRQPD